MTHLLPTRPGQMAARSFFGTVCGSQHPARQEEPCPPLAEHIEPSNDLAHAHGITNCCFKLRL